MRIRLLFLNFVLIAFGFLLNLEEISAAYSALSDSYNMCFLFITLITRYKLFLSKKICQT